MFVSISIEGIIANIGSFFLSINSTDLIVLSKYSIKKLIPIPIIIPMNIDKIIFLGISGLMALLALTGLSAPMELLEPTGLSAPMVSLEPTASLARTVSKLLYL